MKSWRDTSIRWKLVLVMTAAVAGSLVCGFTLVLVDDIAGFRREALAGAQVAARLAANFSVPDLAFDDPRAAEDSLLNLTGHPGFLGAELRDGQERIFAAVGEVADIPEGMRFDSAGHSFVSGRLHIVEIVRYEGRTFGSLHLITSTEGLEDQLRRHAVWMGLVMIALTGLGLVASVVLGRLVTSPILDLAEVTSDIARTGRTGLRADVVSRDEVGQLCVSFNQMLDELELRIAERDEAQMRTREKSAFLAAMSHELRTPLNSIIGFSEVLLRSAESILSPKQLKFLRNIKTSGDHLLGIINDILDLSKVEAGRMNLDLEPVSIEAVVESVVGLMQGSAGTQDVKIRADVEGELPLIFADMVRLRQILFNLVSNAVKFSRSGSTVEISASRLGDRESPLGRETVAVAVRDYGIGIAVEHQEVIFQPFHQVDSGFSRRYEGTGLGLSLVASFVRMHHGEIDIESQLGRGSTFTIYLPVNRPEAAALPAAG